MFSPEEKKLLEHYVTNIDGNVFCVKNLPGMTGAIYARYSRAKGGFREVLLKEFIKEGSVDPEHAQDLIERVLIAFGDDSVGELEGAHVSFEEISMIATKEIEEHRIGGSPIEQSTRYVFYDHKMNDKYRYHRPVNVMHSMYAADYEATMDFVFDTYCSLIEPMKDYYKKLKSRDEAEYDINGDGMKEKYAELTDSREQKAFRITYNADLRTKACDTLRYILPLGTQTNVGIFGNGRFFQTVLTGLYSSPYLEAQQLGVTAQKELDKVIPKYVQRAQKNQYHVNTHVAMKKLAEELFSKSQPVDAVKEVDLLDYGIDSIAAELKKCEITESAVKNVQQKEFDNFTLACMLYPYLKHPFRQIREMIRSLTDAKRQNIAQTYIGTRSTRRDKPYRAFESGYPYTFDMVTDFGTYKDLMRHRMNTQLRQQFTPSLGFQMPGDLDAAGHANKAQACHERVTDVYNKMVNDFPYESSYLVLHGHKMRWMIGMNDREAFHLTELRTTPQGHPSYRRIAQLMHAEIKGQCKWRADAMQFVDYGEYFWARGDSEARQRVKEKIFEEKKKGLDL